MNDINISAMEKILTEWFYQSRELYFFRKDRNPYRVWVTEVILQQTRIQAALKPLERFFSCFPDIATLSNGKDEDILFAFRGLGYYARARNLKKGARYLMEKYGGEMPRTHSELIEVPSIGSYTASAIASICYGEKCPVLDANVKRILSRILKCKDPIQSKTLEKQCSEFLNWMFRHIQFPPGDVNEAWMELGQKICLKSTPKCQICPISTWCLAFRDSETHLFPVVLPKKEKISVRWHLYIVKNEKNEILMQKWNDFYFLKGHQSFPSILEFTKTGDILFSWKDGEKLYEKNKENFLAVSTANVESLRGIKHTITNHIIEIRPYCLTNTSSMLYNFLCSQPVEDKNFSWTSVQNVSRTLSASALIKVWSIYCHNFLFDNIL